MDIGHALKWVVDNYAELSAIGGALVSIGYKIHGTWPDLPRNSPRLEALQDLGSAVWPDLKRAANALYRLFYGKHPPSAVPPVPPLPLLLAMALALTGCPGLPPPDGCAPNAWRCSAAGAPELCSPTTRWTPANRPCSEVNAMCCDQVMSHYGHLVAACMPLGACLQTRPAPEVSQ